MNRLAVFDCDGTLVDSQATICAAVEKGFAACGIAPPGDAAARAIIGLSLPEAMAILHPNGSAAEFAALTDAYKRAFFDMRAAGLAHEPLYDGIAAAVAELDAKGWLLGVATGKSDRGLKLILEHHGLHPRFVTLQTADRHPSKPHPSMIEQAMADAGAAPETTVMIGDTSFDMAMAKAAGATAIGVTWGYHEADMLRAAGADAVATHPDELVAMIEAVA
ncbi:HAD-IA family hydrolase [Sphingomonas nostoxanthinifaciens]|uniref:HAD-IA family hydrolase n=1 Tax=Sphingomonas nostoxanthinifaciens TaxID=2872652 RepID=UPI001CC1F70E|nr:HAD-IA family hydrolase [Sphingomonas nostoxanthinifaciens]UAK26811.1 HAD-IA family hydrolase [Sphingomonas nostoxanthinifaciens]